MNLNTRSRWSLNTRSRCKWSLLFRFSACLSLTLAKFFPVVSFIFRLPKCERFQIKLFLPQFQRNFFRFSLGCPSHNSKMSKLLCCCIKFYKFSFAELFSPIFLLISCICFYFDWPVMEWTLFNKTHNPSNLSHILFWQHLKVSVI